MMHREEPPQDPREDRTQEDHIEEDLSREDQQAFDESRREYLLPRFSLERRVTVLVLLITAMVVGVISTVGIPLELIPRGFESPSLSVAGWWNDAPTQEMLDKVTLPLEEELSTIAGIERLVSVSSNGFARCFIAFKLGTDMKVAYREVRDRVERAKARMPDDVDRVQIRKQDEASVPVFLMGLAIDPELTDAYNLIQNEIILPLQRIDGVASVDAQGLEEKEVLIELDRHLTEASGLDIFNLGEQLGRDNFSLASGHVMAGGKKLLLRSVAKYPDFEALEKRPINDATRLNDIAQVTYDEPEKFYSARANSLPAVAIFVLKEGDANASEVANRVAATVAEMANNPRLSRIDIQPFFDQGQLIEESLSTLLDSGRIGALIAICVLFFFLRRFRMTVIITLSIPLSLLIGLTAMYFFGETLNILSLLGLMISVGLLVDNSVVVAENIHRLHRAGMSRRQAAIHGAGEISLAVVMATLTTIIVFLPASLVEGQGQFFLLRLSIPITVSLLGSLIVALVFVPLSVYLTLPRGAGAGKTTRENPLARFLSRVYRHTLEPINHAYGKLLALFLARRVDLLVTLAIVAGLTGAIAGKQVKMVEVQEGERGFFEIDVRLPQNTTFEESQEYFGEVESYLKQHQEDLDLQGYFIFSRATTGEVQGWFNNPRQNDISPRKAIEQLVAAMPEKPGTRVFTGLESDDQQSTNTLHVMALYGDDASQLEDVAVELEELFTGIDGVLGLKQSGDRPAEEMALVVDRDRAQRLEIRPEVVAGVVRNSIGGRPLPKFYRDGREIPVRIRYQEEDREGLDNLFGFQVPTDTGEFVSLASLTDAQRLDSPKRIVRRAKRVSRTITLQLEDGREQETKQRIRAMAARLDLPEGITMGENRGVRTAQDENQTLLFAILLSIIFIYLLMGFLFESFILPLSIVVTIPLAIIGVFWGHFLSGYDLDPLGLVGVVLLVGVVVNNGIVLVDYINRLRAEGNERAKAILLATDRRFRPIMMTALTTVGGMIPLTLSGTTSTGLSYTSFGVTLISGMTAATLLTLLVVPVAYTFFDDLRAALLGVVSRALRPAPVREPSVSESPSA